MPEYALVLRRRLLLVMDVNVNIVCLTGTILQFGTHGRVHAMHLVMLAIRFFTSLSGLSGLSSLGSFFLLFDH